MLRVILQPHQHALAAQEGLFDQLADLAFRRGVRRALGQRVEIDSPCRILARLGHVAPARCDQELGQQRHWPTGAAFLRARIPGCAGDVQVRPLHALRELAEEGAGRDRAAIAAADIGQVGEVAAQLLGVVFGQRQLPGAIVGIGRRPSTSSCASASSLPMTPVK